MSTMVIVNRVILTSVLLFGLGNAHAS